MAEKFLIKTSSKFYWTPNSTAIAKRYNDEDGVFRHNMQVHELISASLDFFYHGLDFLNLNPFRIGVKFLKPAADGPDFMLIRADGPIIGFHRAV